MVSYDDAHHMMVFQWHKHAGTNTDRGKNLHSHQTAQTQTDNTITQTHSHTNGNCTLLNGLVVLQIIKIYIIYIFLPSVGSKSETPLSLRHAG